jgi:hypothetical protein
MVLSPRGVFCSSFTVLVVKSLVKNNEEDRVVVRPRLVWSFEGSVDGAQRLRLGTNPTPPFLASAWPDKLRGAGLNYFRPGVLRRRTCTTTAADELRIDGTESSR